MSKRKVGFGEASYFDYDGQPVYHIMGQSEPTQTSHSEECIACQSIRLKEERRKTRKLRKVLRFAKEAIRANLVSYSVKDEQALMDAYNEIVLVLRR